MGLPPSISFEMTAQILLGNAEGFRFRFRSLLGASGAPRGTRSCAPRQSAQILSKIPNLPRQCIWMCARSCI